MYGYGFGFGFGCGSDPSTPASASPGPVMPGAPAPLADITAPGTPGVQPGPTPTVPGVHHGLHQGMACVPVMFFPFPNG